MQVQVKVSPTTIITAEADTQAVLFKQLASLTEVFGEEKCAKCGGGYIYRVREVDGDEYFEAVCTNRECRAKLSIGQAKDKKNLFPKRYRQEKGGAYILDENGKKIVKGTWGWSIYNKDSGEEE